MQEGEGQTLQQVLEQIVEAFPDRAHRRAQVGSKVVEGSRFRPDGDCLLCHFIAFIPDDPANLFAHANADLSLLNPPAGSDFIDGELMCLIRGNDVVVCKIGLQESAIPIYVDKLAELAGMDPGAVRFILLNRADVNKLALIEREGVREISFDGVASAAAVEDLVEERPRTVLQSIIAPVGETVRALARAEVEGRPQDSSLKVHVSLTFDKRHGTIVDQRDITALAKQTVEQEDEDTQFEIVTLRNKKVRAEDILLNKSVRMNTYGKSASFEEVSGHLKVYYEELRAPGVAQAAE